MKHLSDSRLPFLLAGLSFLLLLISNFAHRTKFDFSFAVGSALFYGVLYALHKAGNKWLRLLILIIGLFFALVVAFGSLFVCYGTCPPGINVGFVNNTLYLSLYAYLVSAILLTFRNIKIRGILIVLATLLLIFSLVALRF